MEQKLPSLGYEYDALEPYIDAETMEVHYSKHHKAYVDKLNLALKDYVKLKNKSPEELLLGLEKIPEEIRNAVRNNAGGHLNHSFFWPLLKRDVKVSWEILEAIEKNFSSFENFKKEFINSALALFGSGWTWLVVDDSNGLLSIINTSNQDNPIVKGKIPILVVDVWEHAYYLKYQNRRADYLESFFKVINWDKVNENYLNAIK
jgi:superoxide dismutase, Fe-Mn family